MKYLLTLIICLFSIGKGQAQRYTKPYIDCNASIGLFPTFLKANAKTQQLPLQFSMDYRLAKNFSIGASFGSSVTSFSKKFNIYPEQVKWINDFKTLGLRFAAHSNQIGNWHCYGGTYLGIGVSKIDILEGDPEKAKTALGFKASNIRPHITGFIGTRCSLNKRMAVFGELGLGVSLVNIGGSLRI